MEHTNKFSPSAQNDLPRAIWVEVQGEDRLSLVRDPVRLQQLHAPTSTSNKESTSETENPPTIRNFFAPSAQTGFCTVSSKVKVQLELKMMNGEVPGSALPYFVCGEVVKGFGRGSKQLGIPTGEY